MPQTIYDQYKAKSTPPTVNPGGGTNIYDKYKASNIYEAYKKQARPTPTWTDSIITGGLRTIPAIAGGIIGTPADVLTGPLGTAAGGFVGGVVGETLAQWYEKTFGLRESYNPLQSAVQGGISAIPFVGKAPGVGAGIKEIAKFAGKGALQGSALGAASTVPTELAETGQLPSWGQVGTNAAFGGLFGGGTAGVMGKYFPHMPEVSTSGINKEILPPDRNVNVVPPVTEPPGGMFSHYPPGPSSPWPRTPPTSTPKVPNVTVPPQLTTIAGSAPDVTRVIPLPPIQPPSAPYPLPPVAPVTKAKPIVQAAQERATRPPVIRPQQTVETLEETLAKLKAKQAEAQVKKETKAKEVPKVEVPETPVKVYIPPQDAKYSPTANAHIQALEAAVAEGNKDKITHYRNWTAYHLKKEGFSDVADLVWPATAKAEKKARGNAKVKVPPVEVPKVPEVPKVEVPDIVKEALATPLPEVDVPPVVVKEKVAEPIVPKPVVPEQKAETKEKKATFQSKAKDLDELTGDLATIVESKKHTPDIILGMVQRAKQLIAKMTEVSDTSPEAIKKQIRKARVAHDDIAGGLQLVKNKDEFNALKEIIDDLKEKTNNLVSISRGEKAVPVKTLPTVEPVKIEVPTVDTSVVKEEPRRIEKEPPMGKPETLARYRYIAWLHGDSVTSKEAKLAAIKASGVPEEKIDWDGAWQNDTKIRSIKAAEREIEYFKGRERESLDILAEREAAHAKGEVDTSVVKEEPKALPEVEAATTAKDKMDAIIAKEDKETATVKAFNEGTVDQNLERLGGAKGVVGETFPEFLERWRPANAPTGSTVESYNEMAPHIRESTYRTFREAAESVGGVFDETGNLTHYKKTLPEVDTSVVPENKPPKLLSTKKEELPPVDTTVVEKQTESQPKEYKNKQAQEWNKVLGELDSMSPADSAYKVVFKLGGKLKEGETWRGRVVNMIDELEGKEPNWTGQGKTVNIVGDVEPIEPKVSKGKEKMLPSAPPRPLRADVRAAELKEKARVAREAEKVNKRAERQRVRAERARTAADRAIKQKLKENPILEKAPTGILAAIRESAPYRAIYEPVFVRGITQLKRLGKVGEKIAKVLTDEKTESSRFFGEHSRTIREVRRSLSNNEQTEVVKILDGQKPLADASSDAVKAAHTKLRAILDDLGDQAVASDVRMKDVNGQNIPFEKLEGDYFPRRYSDKFYKNLDNIKDALLKETDKEGKLVNSPAAVNAMIKRITEKGERFSSAQHRRIKDMGGYIETLDALEAHVMEMTKAITRAKRLGPMDVANPDSQISRLIASSSNPKKASKIVTEYLNRQDTGLDKEAQHKVYEKIVKAQVWTKLSQFAITNMGDLAAQASNLGVRNTAKAIAKVLANPHGSVDEAFGTGAHTMLRKEIYDEVAKRNLLGTHAVSNASEKFIRTVGAIAGRAEVQRLFELAKRKPAYSKMLAKFVDGDVSDVLKQETLTRKQIDFAGGRAVELTSGVPDRLTLSKAFLADNPMLRLPLLFKRFAFMNTRNIVDAVNDAPTAFAKAKKAAAILAAYQIGGEAVGDVKAAIKGLVTGDIGEELENRGDYVGSSNDTFNRIMANYMQSALFGILGDVTESMVRRKVGKASGILGGPVVSDLDEALGIASDLVSDSGPDKDKTRSLGKAFWRRFPVVGQGLSEAIYPTEKGKSKFGSQIGGKLGESFGTRIR